MMRRRFRANKNSELTTFLLYKSSLPNMADVDFFYLCARLPSEQSFLFACASAIFPWLLCVRSEENENLGEKRKSRRKTNFCVCRLRNVKSLCAWTLGRERTRGRERSLQSLSRRAAANIHSGPA